MLGSSSNMQLHAARTKLVLWFYFVGSDDFVLFDAPSCVTQGAGKFQVFKIFLSKLYAKNKNEILLDLG